jgi:hypothetical protein
MGPPFSGQKPCFALIASSTQGWPAVFQGQASRELENYLPCFWEIRSIEGSGH